MFFQNGIFRMEDFKGKTAYDLYVICEHNFSLTMETYLVLCQEKVQVKRELHLNIPNYATSISSFLNSFQYFFSCSFGDS